MGMSAKVSILALLGALALSGCAAPVGDEIPFPEGYALMPGDRARWAQMNEAERRRALAFMSTGSTIQSSQAGER